MSYWQRKVIVVTGGTAGFGKTLAAQCVRAGSHVVITGRDPERLAAAAGELGASVLAIRADVTQDAEVSGLIEQTLARFGRLDVLVNNVGKSSRGLAAQTSPAQFQELWELNFLTAVRCTQAVLPHLLEARGHIVFMGSLAAKVSSPVMGAYPASKFPLAAYSQQLRLEVGPQGLHVLLVCPGPIARPDAGERYNAQAQDLPDSARKPGGGVRLPGIPAEKLAKRLLDACQRRQPELIMPAKARILFALAQLSPRLADRLILRMTRG